MTMTRRAVLGALASAPLWCRVPRAEALHMWENGATLARHEQLRDAWQRPADMVRALKIRPGDSVADIGAGEGYFLRHLSTALGPAGRVYALDVSPHAIRALTSRAMAGVAIVTNTERSTVLASDSLDAAVMLSALGVFRFSDAMIADTRRALKPGGRLVVVDQDMESATVGRYLSERGFQVIEHDPAFIVGRDPDHARGLVVAVRTEAVR